MPPGDPGPAIDDDELDLRAYLAVLRRRWLSIVLVAALVVAVALAVSLTRDEQYRAGAEVLIRQRTTESLFGGDGQARNAQDAARQLNNEVRLLESGSTRAAVEARYDGTIDVDDVTATVRSDTSDVVEVRVTDTDPTAAADLVNLYVEVFVDLRREQRVDELLAAGSEIQGRLDALDVEITEVRAPLDEVEEDLDADPENPSLQAQRTEINQRISAQLTTLEGQRAFYQQQLDDLRLTAGIAQTGSAQVLTTADPPESPVSPQPLRDGAIALVLGVVLGVGVAFLRDNLDERIRSTADLTRAAGILPTLALIPEIEGRLEAHHVATRDEPRSPAAEAYRSLRTSVKFTAIDRPMRVVQVTSSISGEGKTTTVANLAEALAQGGDKVAIVCCDLRRPMVHERFHQGLTPGFTDVLLGEATLADALRRVEPNLMVLPAGSPPPNPSELLSSPRAASVLKALSTEFDVVILDTTPVLPVTDALVVSRMADATLVVVDARVTKRNALRRTIEMLDQVGAATLGLVLNGVPADGGRYGYGYGYGYGAEADDEPVGRTRRTKRADKRADKRAERNGKTRAPDPGAEPIRTR